MNTDYRTLSSKLLMEVYDSYNPQLICAVDICPTKIQDLGDQAITIQTFFDRSIGLFADQFPTCEKEVDQSNPNIHILNCPINSWFGPHESIMGTGISNRAYRTIDFGGRTRDLRKIEGPSISCISYASAVYGKDTIRCKIASEGADYTMTVTPKMCTEQRTGKIDGLDLTSRNPEPCKRGLPILEEYLKKSPAKPTIAAETSFTTYAKRGLGAMGTVYFVYKAYQEADKWYHRKEPALKEPALKVAAAVDKASRSAQPDRELPAANQLKPASNAGWRAAAYSAAAAASLAFALSS